MNPEKNLLKHMLEKFKTWIFSRWHFLFALIFVSAIFYLALVNFYFLPLFFLVFLISNFYFFRGSEILLGTILIPLPFFFLGLIFQLNQIALIWLWFVYLGVFWLWPQISWLIFVFFLNLILNYFGNYFNLFLPLIFFGAILFFVVKIVFQNNDFNAALKSFILTELFWLIFLTPFGFIWRSLADWFAFVYIRQKSLV